VAAGLDRGLLAEDHAHAVSLQHPLCLAARSRAQRRKEAVGGVDQACADRVGVTKGNVTQHLVHLERRGLVRRDPAGRRNDLSMTESGGLLLSSVLAGHDQGMRELLGVLSAEDLQNLRAILRRLDRGLREREHGLDQEERP
jgi:DNA-binding MarR family transcriptional regulator